MAAAASYFSDPIPRAGVNLPGRYLQSCWPAEVTKFSPGSFYNFEQDNEPLYDLEERSYFNWQKLGFPGGDNTSIHLLVSADAPEEDINCNSNIFTTLQAAINALPKNITTQVRISVASYGPLGDIDIDGFNIKPKEGSLEIVNLNCYDRAGIFRTDILSATYHYDGSITSFATDNNANNTGIYKNFISSGAAQIGAENRGSAGLAMGLLRSDYLNAIGYRPRVRKFIQEPYVASSLDGSLDARAINNYTAFMTPHPGFGKVDNLTRSISRLTTGPTTFSNAGIDNSIYYRVNGTVTSLEESADALILEEIGLYDPSSFQQMDNLTTKRLGQVNQLDAGLDAESATFKGNFYGNSINRLKISNCQGRLYVKNFFCSGGGNTPATSNIGVQIDDCNDVYLESLAVSRYKQMGICLSNSKITVLRSLYIYRCYGFTNDNDSLDITQFPPVVVDNSVYAGPKNKRKSGLWTENIKKLDAPQDDSAGIAAFNSEIVFSEDDAVNYNVFLQSFITNMNDPVFQAGFHTCRMISRCSTGIRLINSIMRGGQSYFFNRFNTLDVDYLNIEGNANYGIEAIDSHIALKSNLQVFQNTRGIKAKNSNIALDSFSIDNNHLYGINLDNSKLQYGLVQLSGSSDRLDFPLTDEVFDTVNTKKYQFIFNQNGHHIMAKNSVIEPGPLTSPKLAYLGRMIMNDAHGAEVGQNLRLFPTPSVLMQNTKADFMHLMCLRLGLDNQPHVGAHFSIKDGSEVTFLGTEKAASVFTTGQTITVNSILNRVGLVAENNSTFKFRGPTVIYDDAVNVLARNNSNIIFEPHRSSDGSLDISGFLLNNPANHTMVELKSIKSCLVADKNSNIVIEDLGCYTETWDDKLTGEESYSVTNQETYTSAGFMQFYPNPNTDAATYAEPTLALSTALNKRGSSYKMKVSSEKYYWGFDYPNALPEDFLDITNGGVCLRALNNSNVRVRNVNFPCGWWNASSVIYDLYDPLGYCGKTFIWNIANNSTLHASYLSVSSDYPSDVGYHGPSAVWVSGNHQIAYGAPSSTVDTSTLSVLDAYGFGFDLAWVLPDGTRVMYGQPTPQNQGPFRLYTGVDSLATQLYQDNKPGYATQVFAQGYNVSGNLSALNDLSGVYGKILRITDEGSLESSGYYYSNEFVKCDPNLIRLDESAANTFANAKNGAMGTSNRPQICSIYSAKVNTTGEGKNGNANSYGSGFRSPNIFDTLEEN